MDNKRLEIFEGLDSVIFDLDGTLWDCTNVILTSWNEVFDKHEEVREKLTHQEVKNYMGTPISEIFEDFLPYIDKDKRDQIEKESSENEINYIEAHGGELYPNLEDVLKELSSKYKLFIVSNCQDGYIESFLKYHGLEDYIIDFEHIGRTGKPKGENIKLIIERNNLKNSIYVGDTDGDRKATRSVGIPFVYARYGFGHVEEYDYAIDNLVELLEIL